MPQRIFVENLTLPANAERLEKRVNEFIDKHEGHGVNMLQLAGAAIILIVGPVCPQCGGSKAEDDDPMNELLDE